MRKVVICIISIFILVNKVVLANDKKQELKVALVLGLTGSASVHSDAISKGAELASEKLKSEDFIINIKFEDDQTNPSKTVFTFKFLLSEGYKFFIGPTWSFQAKAIEAILHSNNAVSLLPAGSSLINGGVSSVFFNFCLRRDKQIVLAETLIKN